jgi:hypothetical protein
VMALLMGFLVSRLFRPRRLHIGRLHNIAGLIAKTVALIGDEGSNICIVQLRTEGRHRRAGNALQDDVVVSQRIMPRGASCVS